MLMRFAVVLFMLLAVTNATATGTSSGVVSVTEIGCHLAGETCYVSIDKVVGPAGCPSTSVRWKKDTDVGGKEALALLTAAYFAGKKVRFQISDTCYGSFPTFHYFHVTDSL